MVTEGWRRAVVGDGQDLKLPPGNIGQRATSEGGRGPRETGGAGTPFRRAPVPFSVARARAMGCNGRTDLIRAIERGAVGFGIDCVKESARARASKQKRRARRPACCRPAAPRTCARSAGLCCSLPLPRSPVLSLQRTVCRASVGIRFRLGAARKGCGRLISSSQPPEPPPPQPPPPPWSTPTPSPRPPPKALSPCASALDHPS